MEIRPELMTTETRNTKTMNLDAMSSLEIIEIMNREDEEIPRAIRPHLKEIAQVIEWGKESLRQGGRMFYIGAGTSGRLGVLELRNVHRHLGFHRMWLSDASPAAKKPLQKLWKERKTARSWQKRILPCIT